MNSIKDDTTDEQLKEQVGGGDEDCLYLAVHVPLREDGGTP